MGTPNKPGEYDCDAAQLPEEPGFKLLGRDPHAAALVRLWADRRQADVFAGVRPVEDLPKAAEARACADQMEAFSRKWQLRKRIQPGLDVDGQIRDHLTLDLMEVSRAMPTLYVVYTDEDQQRALEVMRFLGLMRVAVEKARTPEEVVRLTQRGELIKVGYPWWALAPATLHAAMERVLRAQGQLPPREQVAVVPRGAT